MKSSRAEVMAGKEQTILQAARDIFLRDGYAEASMDGIARAAGVSVKTIYSYFENKSELFSKVMAATCEYHLHGDAALSAEQVLGRRYRWFTQATQHGLRLAGTEYLQHLLSAEQLALYRVVTRDAHQFPQLGQQYRKLAMGRTQVLRAYFDHAARQNGWRGRDAKQDAALYEGLLRSELFEQALHGVITVNGEEINKQARAAAKTMWRWLSC